MITIKNLSFQYSTEEELVLKNINLSVHRGECILLCGKSGCGKSTLLKIINGIIPEFYQGKITGSVEVAGMNPFETEIYKISEKVGSVFQNPKTQFYTTNTTDEIAFALENYGLERAKIQKRLQEVQETMHISALMDRNIFALSGGEKQKIAIAAVYALNPEIFVFDEPSSSLDMDSMLELSKLMEQLKEEGKTIIIAEHRLWYLKKLVDRAVYLENGRITKEYSMKEIQNLSEEERCRTGLRHTDFPCNVWKENSDILLSASEKHTDIARRFVSRLFKVEREDFAVNRDSSGNALELEIKDLLYKRKERTVFNIDRLGFERGKIVGIIGKNGIGKSTFAKVVCGLTRQTAGGICKNNRRISAPERRKSSLLLMQEINNQLFTDSVYDEIRLTSELKEEEQFCTCMADMQIDQLKEKNPHSLSGGQKQRVVILSALLSKKKILFLDEPTSGLDYASMKIVAKNIKKFKAEKNLILIISHDMEFLEEVCDRVLFFPL